MTRWQMRFVECLVIGGIVVLLGTLVLPVDSEGVQEARLAACRHNLQRIGLALHAYHSRYGSFPPAIVADKSGRRLHSWRSLILDDLDYKPLYNSIWMEKPWNDVINLQVLRRLQGERLPQFCPAKLPGPGHHVKRANETSYLAVVGEHTAWPGEKSTSLHRDFPDGPARTILLVEVENSGILWTEPRDLEFEALNFTPNADTAKSISSRHGQAGRWTRGRQNRVVNVLFADGSVKSLPASTSAATIRALLTRDGGEVIPSEP